MTTPVPNAPDMWIATETPKVKRPPVKVVNNVGDAYRAAVARREASKPSAGSLMRRMAGAK